MGFELGDISPLAGAITGKGMMGKLLNPDEAKRIAEKEQAAKMAAEQEATDKNIAAARDQYKQGMKKGGKVSSASKRADGCAMRGKTRGKIY